MTCLAMITKDGEIDRRTLILCKTLQRSWQQSASVLYLTSTEIVLREALPDLRILAELLHSFLPKFFRFLYNL